MSASRSTDARRIPQQLHCPREGFLIKMTEHFPNALVLDLIRRLGGKQALFFHSRHPLCMQLIPGTAKIIKHLLHHCIGIGGLENAAGRAGCLCAQLNGVVHVLAV